MLNNWQEVQKYFIVAKILHNKSTEGGSVEQLQAKSSFGGFKIYWTKSVWTNLKKKEKFMVAYFLNHYSGN